MAEIPEKCRDHGGICAVAMPHPDDSLERGQQVLRFVMLYQGAEIVAHSHGHAEPLALSTACGATEPVMDQGVRTDDDPFALQPDAPAEIDILMVHEYRSVEASKRLELALTHEHGRRRREECIGPGLILLASPAGAI